MPFNDPFPVLAIIGPSASGKSTIARALDARGVVHVHPTWTTRPQRHDELGGSLEHRFVTDATFDGLVEDGFFLDTVAMFGLPHRYGLPRIRRAGDGRVDTVMLRAPLVARFADRVARPLVYQIEDPRADARLRARCTGADELTARLRDNRAERAAGRTIAHRVFVNDRSIEAVVDDITVALAADLSMCAA